MISNYKFYNKLCIDIITYKTGNKSNHQLLDSNMNATSHGNKHDKHQTNFICSVCLNQKPVKDTKGYELKEKKSRSCPICEHSCCTLINGNSNLTNNTRKSKINVIGGKKMTRDVQTSQPDVTMGLSLLNEVLNVFQSNKHINNRNDILAQKTLIFKDIGTVTEETFVTNEKPVLTRSKMFYCFIDGKCAHENKFTIISSSQPDNLFIPHKSLDLTKQKSSSIPQMKLEELKNSLKEKTKSKDAIEEANRLFGALKRVEEKDNRPMVRNGPRVLPVVKTGKFDKEMDDTNNNSNSDQCHKCGYENNYYMSSGDSFVRHNCCNSCKKCDDCVYMLCCHYKENSQRTREIICKTCRMAKNDSEHKS